jgi:hypothetical protein
MAGSTALGKCFYHSFTVKARTTKTPSMWHLNYPVPAYSQSDGTAQTTGFDSLHLVPSSSGPGSDVTLVGYKLLLSDGRSVLSATSRAKHIALHKILVLQYDTV